MNEANDIKARLKDLVAKRKMEAATAALSLVSTQITDAEQKNTLILFQSQYSNLKADQANGIVKQKDYAFQLNRIVFAFLQFIDTIPDAEIHPILTIDSLNALEKKFAPNQWTTALKKIGTYLAALAGILGLMGAIAEFTGYNVRDFIENTGGSKFNLITLEFQPDLERHYQDPAFQKPQLTIDMRGVRMMETVADGRATFRVAQTDSFRIFLNLPGFELARPDSLYAFSTEIIYLKIQSDCAACRLFGTVQTTTAFVKNAIVSVDNKDLTDTTDSKGFFEINIPRKLESHEYPVSVLVKGKIVWQKFITPDPDKGATILIQ